MQGRLYYHERIAHYGIYVTNDHGYVPNVVKKYPVISSFIRVLSPGCNYSNNMDATSGAALPTLPEHLSSHRLLVEFILLNL
jgi:hypothetical protein